MCIRDSYGVGRTGKGGARNKGRGKRKGKGKEKGEGKGRSRHGAIPTTDSFRAYAEHLYNSTQHTETFVDTWINDCVKILVADSAVELITN